MKYLIKAYWWKPLTVFLLIYTVIGGFLMPVPRLPILNETIRILHFHVPMWFGMIIMFAFSVFYSLKYLSTKNLIYDLYAEQLVNAGVLFGILGIISGMVWAKFTWGEPWSNDPKQNASAISLLIYFALIILRGSLQNDHQRARMGAVYNTFAFAVLIPLIFVLPRMTDSLHPGNGGNPAFGQYDLDSDLRMVFYPAVLGWTLLGFWIATLQVRSANLQKQLDYE